MDFEKLNEKLDQILVNEAKIDRNDVDFENVGFGFKVEVGTTKDSDVTLNLVGYSNNSGKDVEYVSNSLKIDHKLSAEQYKEVNDMVVTAKEEVMKDLLEVAKDFDKEVIKVMKKHGFNKTSESLVEDFAEDEEKENARKLELFKRAYEALEELEEEVYGEVPMYDDKELDPETAQFIDRLNKMIQEIYSRSLAFEN